MTETMYTVLVQAVKIMQYHTIIHTHSTIYLPITDLAANWNSKLSMHIQIIIFPLLKGLQDYGNDSTFYEWNFVLRIHATNLCYAHDRSLSLDISCKRFSNCRKHTQHKTLTSLLQCVLISSMSCTEPHQQTTKSLIKLS